MTTADESLLREEPLPFHLCGNYAPVKDEVTAFDLPVHGALPRELRGRYVRNGPNPKTGHSPHWFVGDGMLHGVELRDGRAVWYRNRWVRTRKFVEDAPSIGPDGARDHTVGQANTHVIAHAGRILALVESSFPTEVTRELETVGCFDFGGRLTTAMTAHPKLCPRTGELHFFGYSYLPPYLVYHRADPDGRLVQSEVIEVPGPTMIHDFAITERHVVFMDLPVVFDLGLAMAGGMPYRWSDEYGARVGVMPRGGTNGDVRWFDVATGRVREHALDDRAIEFPRCDGRRVGLPNRYGYAVDTGDGADRSTGTSLIKYDLRAGASVAHDFGPGRIPAEPVFVPAAPAAGEDEGWVLTYVYDAARNGSDLVILDGADFAGKPVAAVALPQRVPFGFHGSWIPDEA